MEGRVIRCLGLAIIFLSGSNATIFTITNNCPFTIWPGTLTGSGPQLSTTGFELASMASSTINVAAPWSGRFWARFTCSVNPSGKFTCVSGDCGTGQVACNGAGGTPPASLVELTLAANGGKDFYDVSLVDGFNIPVSITPQGGFGGCNASSCPANVNSNCFPELQVKSFDGQVVGCKSACLAFNTPEFCCTGEFATPEKCLPTKYSQMFKKQCPQAYSYAYDDKTSTFTCTDGANYLITFCP